MASNDRKEETKKRGSREELWELVDGIETAMMTTVGRDGMLVSRPMATQKRAGGADFWFATLRSPKVEELEADPRVNLSYYRDRTREWVSVSGTAEISKDRAKIRELYAPDWKVWFPDEGGKKDGGPDDPRIVLIGIHARSAQYMTVDKPQPVVFFEFLKGMVTGKAPDFGEVKEIAIRRSGTRTAATASRRSSSPRRGSAGARRAATSRRKKR
ncbi:MAG: pyridoxamine 5'-phosphate oxidase family protein [Thermoanaerobaculia bacterium]